MAAESGQMNVTLLGTGTSTGIPVIGCECRVCLSEDPRDKRMRCACYIEVAGLHILIDAGPDFRTQALRANLKKMDAVLLTHHHFDHVVGLDDLRPYFFNNRAPIPCFAHSETADTLRKMFWYIFEDGSYPGVSKLELHEVDGPFEVRSRYDACPPHGTSTVPVIPVHAFHGKLPVLGYRIGNFAYLTDTSNIPAESMALLQGLDVLVLDALRHEPHRTHFTISRAIKVARELNPRQTYFIHMAHSLLHEEEDATLPERMALGYDGLTFSVN